MMVLFLLIYQCLFYVFYHHDGIYSLIYISFSNDQLYCIWNRLTTSYERFIHTFIHVVIYPCQISINHTFTLNKLSSSCRNHKILLNYKAGVFHFDWRLWLISPLQTYWRSSQSNSIGPYIQEIFTFIGKFLKYNSYKLISFLFFYSSYAYICYFSLIMSIFRILNN